MIFVTVGTQKFQLNRLLKDLENLITKDLINENIYAQTGYSSFIPKHFRSVNFLSQHDFHKQIMQCDILITHGGVGSIHNGLRLNKKVIVYPRLSKYKEHVDDHQLEIAKKYFELGYVLYATNLDELRLAIKEAKNFSSKFTFVENNKIDDYLFNFINGEQYERH